MSFPADENRTRSGENRTRDSTGLALSQGGKGMKARALDGTRQPQ